MTRCMCASRLVLAFFRMLFTSNNIPAIDRRYTATHKKEKEEKKPKKKRAVVIVIDWFFDFIIVFVHKNE